MERLGGFLKTFLEARREHVHQRIKTTPELAPGHMTGPRLLFAFAAVAIMASLAFSGCLEKKTASTGCPEIDRTTLTLADKNDTVVAIGTSMGCIVVELFDKKAPITAANFRTYVSDKFYDNTCFHRVIAGFVVQGGGFDRATCGTSQKPTRPAIKLETQTGLKNYLGTLSMARTNVPDSATSQFFINSSNNTNSAKPNGKGLDPGGVDPNGYAVFGKVVQGLDVAKNIEGVKTNAQDQPVETVYIIAARFVTSASQTTLPGPTTSSSSPSTTSPTPTTTVA